MVFFGVKIFNLFTKMVELNICMKTNAKELKIANCVATIEAQTPAGPSDYEEKWYHVLIQVLIPFMLAGMGTIGAGIVLGSVEHLDVFHEVKALYIMVPSMLGLKGNLDMCLASRLSTQANLGTMSSSKEVVKLIVGNLGLVQIQSIVASCLVSGVAIVLSGQFIWEHCLLLAASSILTATISCLILDMFLIAVIYFSRKLQWNPDNLATPLAASIGDVVSLFMLSTIARELYKIHDTYEWVFMVILAVYILVFLPIWIFIVRRNEYTCKVLTNGWVPVIGALIISCFGGLVLDQAVDQFKGYSVFQPIINGIGGNLVSIHSSRISTMLHKHSEKGGFPSDTKKWVAPWTALFMSARVRPAETARILLMICIPGHIVFAFIADLIYNNGESTIKPPFLLTYLSVGFIQVVCLLYICHLLVHILWSFKIDPDNFAIPFLTSIGDLLGSILLFVAFLLLHETHNDYVPPHLKMIE